MDVWAITVAVVRRWYVFLPLLALTVLAALWVGGRATEESVVTATVVLVPGSESSEIENPYGGIGETAQVLEIVLGSRVAHEALEEKGLSPDYAVNARSQSRIMDLSITGSTSEVSLATADELLAMARKELSDRQEEVGIPEAAQIGVEVLRVPAVTDVVADGKLRNMAVVGIAGGALSLVVAVIFDDLVGLARRWRGSSRHSAQATSDPERSTETDGAG